MNKNLLCLWIFLLIFSSLQAQEYKIYKRKKYTLADSLRGALRPERTCFDVTYYDLHLKIIPQKKYIQGHNEIHFKLLQPASKIQIDLFNNLTLDSIVFQGQKLKYEWKYNAIFIHFNEILPQGSLQLIKVYYQGKPLTEQGTFKDKGFHWDTDSKLRDWVGISCEQTGASLWFPNKEHLSDEPDSVRLHYTIPKQLKCVANGRLEKISESDQAFTTWHWVVRNPINNYNITLNLGHYKVDSLPYKNASGLHQLYYYYLDNEEKSTEDEYFKLMPQFVSFFETLFGEYPYWNDKFAVIQSCYRGMEHQGCLSIGQNLLDRNNFYYRIGVNYHSTLIHEIAHEWWGNSVSASDMADAWLHESFATYCEMLFIEAALGKDAYVSCVNHLKKFFQNSYPIVGNRDVNEDTFDQSDIYMKGAYLLHQLRKEINNDRIFLAILKLFQLRYKNKTVTTQDFIQLVNEVSKKDYTQFLMDGLYKKY